ncbi:MAG: leucine-rich repeat domain-containing protein, partial [Spirochaetaceae bacterium]|nr:leucine-rich repeat domain-containing protein [Spirochaetaceae bacterium]
ANLPKNLKQITDYTFGGCGELSDLIIPDTLKTLEFVSWGSKGYGASDSWMKDGSPNYNGADGAVYTAKSFTGCGKLPIKTRQKLQELGYKDSF